MFKKNLKSDILFTGYYGQLNTGDDAFIEVAAWGAEKYWNKKNNRFLAIKNGLPTVKLPVKGYPVKLPKSYKLQNKLLIPTADYLISAGGSTLCNKLKGYDAKSIALKRKEKINDIKLGAIGVSVGPFKSSKDEKSIINYLKNLDFLSVRDKASFKIVKELDLPYEPVHSFDLAALLPTIYGINKSSLKKDRKVIGVSVCPYESITNKRMLKKEYDRNNRTVELLKNLDKRESIHFKFFIINGHDVVGDLKTTQDVIRKLNPDSYEIVDYNKETNITWNEVSSCDFIVATRLHAAIFACFSNTPFILNEYHRKCGDFLDDVSYDQSLRVFDSEYDVKDRADCIINILNDKNNYTAPKKIEEMTNRSELNFTAVDI